jgi:hypothetical protein
MMGVNAFNDCYQFSINFKTGTFEVLKPSGTEGDGA